MKKKPENKNKGGIRKKIIVAAGLLFLSFCFYYTTKTLIFTSEQVKFNTAKIRVLQKIADLKSSNITDISFKYALYELYDKSSELIDKHDDNYIQMETTADLLWQAYERGAEAGYEKKRYELDSL
jgi:hypothetical protein